ncbi:MAG: FAD-dependent oxidoreductase [Burkholderiaceae bacterium]|nr:FAD-dependent oxidoreductase [Burkholderiaceae bacterium]
MNKKKWLLIAVLLGAVTAFFALGLHRYFTLAEVKARQVEISDLFVQRPVLVVGLFFATYLAVAALSLPGAALLTLLGGAIFGVVWGTVIVSFASSIGATLSFLSSRYLFREAVQKRFGTRLGAINRGIERDGGFYLVTLRLVPVFPFFAVNLLMGLTPISTRAFYVASQIGMFLGTVVYVNVGTQLAGLESLRGIVSPGLLASFAALGLLPLAARKIVSLLEQRKVYAPWAARRPARFDRNIVVIGAGSAGLVTAYIAAAVKASVTLIERHQMGGDCLNTGCVPSKALIRSAKLLHQARKSQAYGIREMQVGFEFADVMERVQRVIRTIEPHDSVQRYTSLGVDCVKGQARIVSPWEVEVTEPAIAAGDAPVRRVISARSIVIAAGARPLVPPIPGLQDVGYLTSDNVWAIRELPARLIVLGGGPIGCELAQSFARFGSQVTQVEMAPRLLIREDPEVSTLVAEAFTAEGIDVRVGHKALRFEQSDGQRVLVAEHQGAEVRIAFDQVLLALGRSPNTAGYGLEEMGIATTAARTVEVDGFLRTRFPNIFACGDVAGPYQFTHTAAHAAWFAAVNALFGRFKQFPVDWSVVPWCTFTDPEVARVGLNETEAAAKGIAYEVSRFGIDDLDRAIADEAAHGFIKVLTVPGKDRILGVTIVGEHAGDLIAEYVAAMKQRIGLNKVLGTMHIYPTLAEANKFVAGEWKRAHAPQRLLGWVRRYHQWQLG